MARKRFVPTSAYALQTTKGHSSLRQRHYPAPFHRRPLDDMYLHEPFRTRPSSYPIDTSHIESMGMRDVNRELILSSSALEDNFDLASKSRNRDREVLSAATRAIPPSGEVSAASPASTSRYAESSHLPSLRRSNPKRSSSLPPVPSRLKIGSDYVAPPSSSSAYRTTTTVVPLNLSPKTEEHRTPYLSLMNKLDTTRKLNEGSYEPTSSYEATGYGRLRAGYISPAAISPYSTPLASGTQTPVEYDYESPHFAPTQSTSNYRKRHKPRVIATKRRVGNYYDRLLQRRSTDGSGRSSKYWPYINVEDIESDSVGDLLSDTESQDGGETYYPAEGSYYTTEGATGGGDYGYSDDDDVYYDTENIPKPVEYIPFRPRPRVSSPEPNESSSYFDQLSVTPYLPKRDPTKTSVSDDLAFNAIVAASAARARRALQNINLEDYDTASLVISVEGEYEGPKSEVPVGFRYVSRPLPLKTPASLVVSAYDSDNVFDKYVTDMQRFREGIRSRLEEGYKALAAAAPECASSLLPRTEYSSSYVPRKHYSSSLVPRRDYSSALSSYSYGSGSDYSTPLLPRSDYSSRSSVRPLPTRLRDGDGYKYGHSLEVYPLPSRSSERALPSYTADRPETHAVKLYDSESDSKPGLSTLSKIQIKVDTELHTSPRSAVAARRAQRGPAKPVVYSPPSNVQRKEAALVGSRVDVITPDRKRPKSKYAQAKLRQIQMDKRSASPIIAESTSGLRASKPSRAPAPRKAIRDVDGYTQTKNILSWQTLATPQGEYDAPVSGLRRRIRRVVATSKGNPNYYRS